MERRRGWSGRRWLVCGVAMGLVLAAGTWWLLARGTRGAEIATVLALSATVLGVLVAARPGTASADWLVVSARRLAGDVRAQEAAVLARLLADTGDPRPAELFFAQPALIYWRTDGGDRRSSLGDIEGYYRGLRRGRMVVQGAAGAGKTVLAIQLILDLATSAAAALDAPSLSPSAGAHVVPVPVRLSLPAFNPAGDDELDDVAGEVMSARLDTWLTDHVVAVYGVAKKAAAALVTGGWVLPVLDGLDEMDPDDGPPRRAAAVIRAINHPTAAGLRPLILTCRTLHYQQLTGQPAQPPAADADREVKGSMGGAPVVVQDATVVGIEPLTVSDVITYLTYRFPDPAGSDHGADRWQPVLQRLKTDRCGDPLVAALTSPLRLFLAVTAYRNPDTMPDELTRCTTAGQVDEHLFGLLIAAVTEQHPTRSGRRYPAHDVTRWLTTLTRHLSWQGAHAGSASDLRLDTLWPAAGWRAPRYLGATLLTAGIIPFLVLSYPVLRSDDGPFFLLSLLSTVGLASGMGIAVAWTSSRPRVNLQRLDLASLRTSSGHRRFATGFKTGLGAGIGLAAGLEEGLGLGLTAGLTAGLTIGLTFGFRSGLTVRPVAVGRPSRLVTQGLAHTAAVIVASVLITGLLAGLRAGLGAGLGAGLMFGLTYGLMFGLYFVCDSPWPRYAVACLILARRSELPARPAVFLDWAYTAGLVRMSGIAVHFRHREFQAWLAGRDPQALPSAAAAKTPPPPAPSTPAVPTP